MSRLNKQFMAPRLLPIANFSTIIFEPQSFQTCQMIILLGRIPITI